MTGKVMMRHSSTGSASSVGNGTAVATRPTRSDSPSKSNASQPQQAQQSSAAAASSSLNLLLREDHLLKQHELHISNRPEEAAFSYAADLLQQDDDDAQWSSSSGTPKKRPGGEVQQRATEALAEVDRKLALVESLAERVSRTSPKAVAGPLLRLHGYTLETEDVDDASGTAATTTTLVATRERCHRLRRQGEVLEGVGRRVESSLQRGLKRMETATSRLSRVLDLSATLKMILRMQFESSKLQGFVLEDLRDLTRAAASVAVLEDLLARPELNGSPPIEVVEAMRPEAQRTASEVRRAASALLAQHHERRSAGSAVQLGATLQVYYHLGELPQAAWSAVEHGLSTAEEVSHALFAPGNLQKLMETATAEAKAAVGLKHKPGETERVLKKKLREMRAEAASRWASGIADASLQVWNLHRVLCRKSDPVSRQVFVDVVSAAPIPDQFVNHKKKEFTIFGIFWEKLCHSLGEQLEQVLEHDHGKLAPDVAGLYPAVRAAALDMLGSLYDTMHTASGLSSIDDVTATSSSSGLLGGSAGLDDAFLGWTTTSVTDDESFPALAVASADTWTRADATNSGEDTASSSDRFLSSTTTSSLSAIFQSSEWKTLQGSGGGGGLFPLQQAFLKASHDRLCAPLQYMFPEGIAVDEDGVAIATLPTLPSRYDLQKLDQNIRQELSLADPREGGGELSMTTMIAETIVDMVKACCDRATGAVSNAGEDGCLHPDGTATEALTHDLKVSRVMSALATSLRSAPENTFVVPYRPAISPQHEEAAALCEISLLPALDEIENMVRTKILTPLCRALDHRVAAAIAKVHQGTYLSESLDVLDGTGTSFVQKHLAGLYEGIAENLLAKLPAEYANIVAATVAIFSVYTFVSNISLIRPLGETARLHITQDLADFELALEQLVFKGSSSTTLSQIEHGKPYAELRAVRQMLFWTGLEDESTSASSLAKSMLREVWVKDVRPSTVFHFLFSFAPPLLSSPHHAKRMKPEEYVNTLVQLNGSVDDGEANAWMITMECCDSYQQRESVDNGGHGGDRRVAAVLMMLGPELLRRRRH